MSISLAPVPRLSLPARLGAWAQGLLAPQKGRLAPWLAVALGVGVLAYFQRAQEPGFGLLWLMPPLAAIAFAFGRRHALAGWALGMLAAGMLGFGAAAWQAARLPPPLQLPATQVILQGEVAEVQRLPEGIRLTLANPRLGEGEVLPRTLRVRLRTDDPAIPRPGDALRVRALLREPGAPSFPGAWDFQRSAFFAGQGGSGFALGPAEILPGAGSAPPLAGLRADLDARVAAAIPGAAGAVAAALLTGTQSAIPPAEMVAMRDSGLAHLLSVSGLHMAIVMGVVFGALRILLAAVPFVALRLNGKPVAAVAALAAGFFYMVLTGSQVPMQRCFAMAALVTLALLTGRRALALRPIALAAAAVLLVAPAEILGPSFQMSFAAVLALIAGHEAWRGRLARFRQDHPGPVGRFAVILLGLMVTSALAGAATAPFGLHHFGRLQLYGIAANALAVPLTSFLVMPAGLVAMLLLPLGLEDLALVPMGWGVEGILAIARAVAAWPGAAPALPPIPSLGLALAAFGFCWLCLWRARLRLLGLPMILAGLTPGLWASPPDLLISAEGRMVALRTEQGVYLHQMPGASAFTREAWARHFAIAGFLPLPEQGEAAGGAIACTPAACRFQPREGAVTAVLLRTPAPPRGAPRRGVPIDPAALAEACGQAGLLVASEPIRPRCAHGVSIDRFTVWRDGAQAVWLEAGVRVVSDRAWRGERPWVPPIPIPGRPEPLPLAPVDPGIVSPRAADR
jgi:competence protein ComEC